MSGETWRRPAVNEALALLYLRLNGYFTTGLVVQSPEWGENQTDIDCFAIRHPNHAQPERTVTSAPFLALKPGILDLIICEVKSVPAEVAFNERLCADPAVLENVLRWAGVFAEEELPRLAAELAVLLRRGLLEHKAQEGVAAPGVRVRGLLSCPPASEAELPSGWCLRGSEILRYANECFNPPMPRDTSSTRYNFVQWGRQLAPIVRYFKQLKDPADASVVGLYEFLNAA